MLVANETSYLTLWHDYAQSCQQLVELTQQAGKVIFISYAWPPANSAECNIIHERLKRLKAELEATGAIVKLDICNLSTSITDYMAEGIDEADAVLLIGTPRLKSRLEETENNNAKIEFEAIQKRMQQQSGKRLMLFPLIAAGNFTSSFPAGIEQTLARPLPNPISNPEQQVDYYGKMTAASPLGLIPALYGFDKPACSSLYANITTSFMSQLQQHQTRLEHNRLFVQATQVRESRNHEQAFGLFFQLALAGDARACYIVAAYYHGPQDNFTDNPVSKDLVRAEQFYRRGAALGHAKCMRRLAESLATRTPSTANPANTWQEALGWIEKAVNTCLPDDRATITSSKTYLECQHARYQAEHEDNNEAKLRWARHLYNATGGYHHDTSENKRSCLTTALRLAQEAEQAGITNAIGLTSQIQATLHHLDGTPRTEHDVRNVYSNP